MVFWNLRSSAKSAEKLILSARKALVRKTIVVILPGMSTIQEIESAVSSLSQKELAAFREWFAGLTPRRGTSNSRTTFAPGSLMRWPMKPCVI